MAPQLLLTTTTCRTWQTSTCLQVRLAWVSTPVSNPLAEAHGVLQHHSVARWLASSLHEASRHGQHAAWVVLTPVKCSFPRQTYFDSLALLVCRRHVCELWPDKCDQQQRGVHCRGYCCCQQRQLQPGLHVQEGRCHWALQVGLDLTVLPNSLAQGSQCCSCMARLYKNQCDAQMGVLQDPWDLLAADH